MGVTENRGLHTTYSSNIISNAYNSVNWKKKTCSNMKHRHTVADKKLLSQ